MTSPRFWVTGLSHEEAKQRLRDENVPSDFVGQSLFDIFYGRWEDPIVRLLTTATAIAAVVGTYRGEYAEFLGLFLTIVLTTVFGTANEYIASSEFRRIDEVRQDSPVKVIRNSELDIVSRRLLVRGDFVLLEAGDEAPVCGRLVHANGLVVDRMHAKLGVKASSHKLSDSTGKTIPPNSNYSGIKTIDAIYPSFDSFSADSFDNKAVVPEIVAGCLVTAGRCIVELYCAPSRGACSGVIGANNELVPGVGQDSPFIDRCKTILKDMPTASGGSTIAECLGHESPLGRQLEQLGALVGMGGLSAAGMAFLLLAFRRLSTGELILPGQGWLAVTLVSIGLLAATLSIWLPFVYSMLSALGMEVTAAGLFDEKGLKSWGLSIMRGLGIFIPCTGLAILAGFLSPSPGEWLSPASAETLFQDLMFSLAIIIVAVPDGLGMSVTLSLAGGLRRMMTARALVRRPGAAETIGAVSRLLIDHGIPLTTGVMRLVALDVPALPILSRLLVPDESEARLFVEVVSVSTTANLGRSLDGRPATIVGDPLEGALLRWLHEAGFDYLQFRNTFTVIERMPWHMNEKITVIKGISVTTGRSVLYARGDPNSLLSLCSSVWTADRGLESFSGERRLAFERYFASQQGEGRRMLAFAAQECCDALRVDESRDLHDEADSHGLMEEAVKNLVWIGCASFEDISVPEAAQAIRVCREAGIRITLVSSEDSVVAAAFARRLGILEPGDGQEVCAEARSLEGLSVADARRIPISLCVVSQANAADKLMLTELYDRLGETVAVTGESLEDVPALRMAALGIAPGKSGSAAARIASDLILLDDAISGFERAVMWGRSLYENIRRFLVFQLTINVFAVSIELLGPFIGVRMPLTVAQMLWLNLVMDILAPFAIAAEPPRPETMKRPPRNREESILSTEMVVAILGSAGLFLAVSVALLMILGADGEVSSNDLTLFFTVSVFFQFWNLFNARAFGLENPGYLDFAANSSFLVTAGLILMGQFMIVTFGGKIFATVPLDMTHWLLVLMGTCPVLFLGGLWRYLFPITRGRERRLR
ncbi:MAG: cation-translocating P-type ATPase [Candidatus Riflebacteria bacterium]|nr:cation-translocating P-type ATPase [Candidatus Riflebacteria bacterium]